MNRVTEGRVERVLEDGEQRIIEMAAAQPPSGPITILNFTGYLGQILAGVSAFQGNWQAVINNQTEVLQNQITITNIMRDQTEAISGLGSQVAALNTNISNVVALMEAIIQALGGVATLSVQGQQINLLNQILQFLDATVPATIGLDTAASVTKPQPAPSRRGP